MQTGIESHQAGKHKRTVTSTLHQNRQAPQIQILAPNLPKRVEGNNGMTYQVTESAEMKHIRIQTRMAVDWPISTRAVTTSRTGERKLGRNLGDMEKENRITEENTQDIITEGHPPQMKKTQEWERKMMLEQNQTILQDSFRHLAQWNVDKSWQEMPKVVISNTWMKQLGA